MAVKKRTSKEPSLVAVLAPGGGPEKIDIAGVEVWFWSARGGAKAVLFVAHGMCHGAYD